MRGFAWHGASIVAEGGEIEIGDNCVILENAVLRSAGRHNLRIGNNLMPRILGAMTGMLAGHRQDRSLASGR